MYRLLRNLHLYLGLLVSPFVLLFAASVFYLNHGTFLPGRSQVERHDGLHIPDGFDTAKGAEALTPAKSLMQQLGVAGEIGYVRHMAADRRVVFPVTNAVLETTVDVEIDARRATVTRRHVSLQERIAYLHKMPGPHNSAVRGNSAGMVAWGWLADATIYLLLFLTISGLYLWWALSSERITGILLLTAGWTTLAGLVYAIIR